MSHKFNGNMIKIKKNILVKNNLGFTLIEVIAVLLIIGIIAAVASYRMIETGYEVVVQRDVIMNHLRYAQIKAMSTNTPWYIVFKRDSYELHEFGGTPTTLKRIPGEEIDTVGLFPGVSSSPTDSIISYNQWGKPAIDAGALILQGNSRTLTFTKGSNISTITIISDTGLLE
jgi:prepilin-type N-terminal cleavage/methylation domain-containing protein